MYLAGKQSH
jgi:hypothetical protein